MWLYCIGQFNTLCCRNILFTSSLIPNSLCILCLSMCVSMTTYYNPLSIKFRCTSRGASCKQNIRILSPRDLSPMLTEIESHFSVHLKPKNMSVISHRNCIAWGSFSSAALGHPFCLFLQSHKALFHQIDRVFLWT